MTDTPRRRSMAVLVTAVTTTLFLTSGCGEGEVSEVRLQEALEGWAERFTPGLHEQMIHLQFRHASLWFAGEEENWELADYMIHELEELVEEIEEANPVYRGVAVAELLGEMTHPAIEAIETAITRRDRDAFRMGYDQLTTACNACHIASERPAIVMQRPDHPPYGNLRFTPSPESQ